jgi:hypothetical protein
MGWILIALMGLSLLGLVGVYAWLVNDMAKGLDEQVQHRLALEARLRKKGIIE